MEYLSQNCLFAEWKKKYFNIIFPSWNLGVRVWDSHLLIESTQ